MKILATIEARMGSTRLPGKVAMNLSGKSMLEHILERVKFSKSIDEIIVATTLKSEEKDILSICEKSQVKHFKGSENDILERLTLVVNQIQPDILVSLTGDNPFIDSELIDDCIKKFIYGNFDYLTTTHMQHTKNWKAAREFPIGVSLQIVKAKLVKDYESKVKDTNIRELGLFSIYDDIDGNIAKHAFEAKGKYLPWNNPDLRMTVDTIEDFEMAREIYKKLYPNNKNFSTLDAIKLLLSSNEIKIKNKNIKQRLGYKNLKS